MHAIDKINRLASAKKPFLFIIDYKGQSPIIIEPHEIDSNELSYQIESIQINKQADFKFTENYSFEKYPMSLEAYSRGFNIVMDNLRLGNSYLTNYTCPTQIKTNLTLDEIYFRSKVPYKLLLKNRLVVFSPETFIKINNGAIFSYPMKGTIDACIENATEKILTDRKESAEHATIVDLIRNDLSRVSTNVKVDRYRYIDAIETDSGKLLQVSSQISGILPNDYQNNLGEIIFDLLPAGSISGAPKLKTTDIIEQAEAYQRGFYTGIFGYFDGTNLDSAVMIRFIENQNGQLVFKSGGGITVNSNLKDEYQEMLRKVYLPF